ncbi:hypothetical protein ACLKA7_009810 [Drosophila subpalustris]
MRLLCAFDAADAVEMAMPQQMCPIERDTARLKAQPCNGRIRQGQYMCCQGCGLLGTATSCNLHSTPLPQHFSNTSFGLPLPQQQQQQQLVINVVIKLSLMR